jgi:hypothetical protein
VHAITEESNGTANQIKDYEVFTITKEAEVVIGDDSIDDY